MGLEVFVGVFVIVGVGVGVSGDVGVFVGVSDSVGVFVGGIGVGVAVDVPHSPTYFHGPH